MARMFKVLHMRNHLFKAITDYLNIGFGTRRLLFLTLVLVLLQHVVACLWIFFASFDDLSRNNWIFHYNYTDLGEMELYVTSFYFTVTTIMTVGYGDITARSLAEKLLCILLMLIGVISFSFATGAISSIITNQDTAEAKLKEKMQTLESIQTEY